MLRVSKTCMHLCFLVGILMSSCSNNPSSNTPIPSPLPTLPAIEEWFGMQVSSDIWQAEKIENTIYQHGLLTHHTLIGCRALILSGAPPDVSNYEPDWDNSSHRTFSTATISLDLWRMKDKNGNLKDTYFEINDTTGRSGHDLLRLACVLVESGDSPIQCIDAVSSVLSSINPELFPNIGVGQG